MLRCAGIETPARSMLCDPPHRSPRSRCWCGGGTRQTRGAPVAAVVTPCGATCGRSPVRRETRRAWCAGRVPSARRPWWRGLYVGRAPPSACPPSGGADMNRRGVVARGLAAQRQGNSTGRRVTVLLHDGGDHIGQALAQHGLEPAPSQRTISRLLHRYAKEGTESNPHPLSVHQLGNVLPVLTWLESQGKMAT